ncbi:MAG: cytochrome C oxidase subunit IV family protein [Tepidisphaeraceae bacterium]
MTAADAHGRMPQEPEEPHGTTVPMPHHHVNYYAIFATLVVLTAITVGVYFLHPTSELVKILLALLIASVKALLVAYFFMHLKFEGKLIYTIFIVPLILCVLLVVALIPDVLKGPLFNPAPGEAAASQAEHVPH